MRYIAKENGHLLEVSFGAIIQCNGKDCTAYTGGVPAGYSSLADWFTKEADKLHRWKIVSGELTRIENVREPTTTAPFGIYKIWKNPKPDEVFPEQTVLLDVGEYSGAFVYFKGTATGSEYYTSATIPAGAEAYIHCHALNGDTYQRLVKLTKNGVDFGAGRKGDTEDNALAVPVEVYAFSGLIDKTNNVHAICGTFLCGEVVAGQ